MAGTKKVVTKYQTKGGAIVSVTEGLYGDRFDWACAACSESGRPRPQPYANEDAQKHASRCRALPLD